MGLGLVFFVLTSLLFLHTAPQIITMGAKFHLSLKQHERRSFVLRVSTADRRIDLDIVRREGQTKMIELKKHKWVIPFDGGMKFDRDHNVRRSLNIVGKSFSFVGKPYPRFPVVFISSCRYIFQLSFLFFVK